MYTPNIHGIVDLTISSHTNSHSQQFCWQPKNMLVIFLTLNFNTDFNNITKGSTVQVQWTYVVVKLITNRWAWALVPPKLAEPGNALAQGRRYKPWQPCEGPHQAPSQWTGQWNPFQPICFFPLPGPELKREGGLEKNTAQKLASKQQGSSAHTLRRTASKQLLIQVTRCPC